MNGLKKQKTRLQTAGRWCDRLSPQVHRSTAKPANYFLAIINYCKPLIGYETAFSSCSFTGLLSTGTAMVCAVAFCTVIDNISFFRRSLSPARCNCRCIAQCRRRAAPPWTPSCKPERMACSRWDSSVLPQTFGGLPNPPPTLGPAASYWFAV